MAELGRNDSTEVGKAVCLFAFKHFHQLGAELGVICMAFYEHASFEVGHAF
ncbi:MULTISPECIES: hypothetical protein [Gordonibacter]|uniref:Uncharacterized protein n=1 Tax=Gordonibacter faecis TaxID=3047475 RepID=A0ABT7DLX3_9ACTN|nr:MULTISPECIES: hypothetical protein [unclassified Gordonibacter]MDJ1650520.1 hypothetical protein [Gordonibacter sp. KGMB12511]HIW76392.1 hypothetical protein [Candidatus Gordonibacter avicola]